MTTAKKSEAIRVRSCCACDATIVTPQELANRSMRHVPRGMRLFAGTFRDRPFCADCLPAEGKKGTT